MRRFLATTATISLALILPCLADEASDRAAALAALARDIAEIQYAFPASQTEYTALATSGGWQDIWDTALQKASALRDAWRTNPYVEVTGFSVTVGWPPSIEFQFDFKETPPGTGQDGASKPESQSAVEQ